MPKKLKSGLMMAFKLVIAVVAMWCAVWLPWKPEPQITWLDRGIIKANTEIRAVTFLDPVPVWIWKKTATGQPSLPPGTLAVKPAIFNDQPHRVMIDGHELSLPLNDPRIFNVFVGDGSAEAPPEISGWKMVQWFRVERPGPPGIAVPQAYLQALPKQTPTSEDAPAITLGIRTLALQTNPWLLLAAWAVLVVPFLVTAWRWQKLMEPQGIFLPYSKCLALTFVGQFYSILLPGVTGGDVVKIIYTARVTGSKTKSMITVLLDRVIGLGGAMVVAGFTALLYAAHDETMRHVAMLLGAVLFGLAVGTFVYFSHRLRRITGLKWFLNHEIVPDFVRRADEVLHAYRGHWRILADAFGASLVAQITLPLSAWLAGMAFGIENAHLGHYLAYVPLALVTASIPISPPQGIGIYEAMLTHFFSHKNLATASQAFALAQAIRFLPMLWNLLGAYWVVTGSYSRHQALEEEAQLKKEEAAPAASDSPPLAPLP